MNDNKYHMACMIARPCNCNAPIAETSINDDEGNVNITLYTVDEYLTIKQIFASGLFDDYDDLNLICTKCGTSWATFNPLFD